MQHTQFVSQNKPTSLCEKLGEKKSLIDDIEDLLSDLSNNQGLASLDEKLDKLSKKLSEKYLVHYDKKGSVISQNEAVYIQMEAATIYRFYCDALFSISTSDVDEKIKDRILKKLFCDGSKYKEIEGRYFGEGKRVKQAQDIFRELKIKPLFSNVITDYNIQDLGITAPELFSNYSKLKDSPYFKGRTNGKLSIDYQSKVDKNILKAVFLGIAASDPKKVGVVMSLIGDRGNEGKIEFLETKNLGMSLNSAKGAAYSMFRCFIILAAIAASIYLGVFIAPQITGLLNITALTAEIACHTFCATASIGAICIGTKKLDSKVKKREEFMNKYCTTGLQGIKIPKTDIDCDVAIKYVLYPFYKAREADRRRDFSKLENMISNSIMESINSVLKNDDRYAAENKIFDKSKMREAREKFPKQLDVLLNNIFQTAAMVHS